MSLRPEPIGEIPAETLRVAGAAFPKGTGLGLRRTTLHQLMVDRAADAGVRLLWGARITGIGKEVVLADDRMVRTRWIVGADGGQSTVRRWAGMDACTK